MEHTHSVPDLQRIRFNKLHRPDWREVLQSRDQKRAARRTSIERRQSRRHSAGFVHLAYMLAIIAFSLLTLGAGWALVRNAVHSLHSRASCDSPIHAAETRAEVRSMLDCI